MGLRRALLAAHCARMASIALCVICGNEEELIGRMLDSFCDAFDVLSLVRAIGCAKPDNTRLIASDWCYKNGKRFHFEVYQNSSEANSWPHVDNFAAARNLSFRTTQCDWRLWADCDDLLAPGAATKIREIVERPEGDVYFFTYVIENTGETILRERMFRKGVGEWQGALHENCIHDMKLNPSVVKGDVAFHHRPAQGKPIDRERNRKILFHATKDYERMAFNVHREYCAMWKEKNDEQARDLAMRWAEICRVIPMHDEMRLIVILHQAGLARDLTAAKNFAWEAIRLMPGRREGYAALAQLELEAKEPARALAFTSLLPAMPRPQRSAIPIAETAYGWPAWDLHLKAMRACGLNDAADKFEKECALTRPKDA